MDFLDVAPCQGTNLIMMLQWTGVDERFIDCSRILKQLLPTCASCYSCLKGKHFVNHTFLVVNCFKRSEIRENSKIFFLDAAINVMLDVML